MLRSSSTRAMVCGMGASLPPFIGSDLGTKQTQPGQIRNYLRFSGRRMSVRPFAGGRVRPSLRERFRADVRSSLSEKCRTARLTRAAWSVRGAERQGLPMPPVRLIAPATSQEEGGDRRRPIPAIGERTFLKTIIMRNILSPSPFRVRKNKKREIQMTRISRTAAALVVAAGMGGLAQGASAQSLPKFCAGDVLATNSFYANILSNGSVSQVEYHGMFQNMDPNRRTITATMSVVVARFGNWEITRPLSRFTLGSYQQNNVVLMVLRKSNPSGAGAPSASEVGSQIRFTCTFS